jgi:hypothetical protein
MTRHLGRPLLPAGDVTPRHPLRVHPGGVHARCRSQAQLDRCPRRADRSLHPEGTTRLNPLRQLSRFRCQSCPGLDYGGRRQDRRHRARLSLGERLRRKLQYTVQGRIAQR